MKLNERLYDVLGYLPYKEPEPGQDYVPVASTPIETQVCGKHNVEIYYMNEYKEVLNEFTKQGKFAVWSSKDGVNYRLAVEKDYYAKVSELYTMEVNEKWLKFWDDCDVIQTKFSRHIVLPLTLVVVVLFLFFANWNNMFKSAQMDSTLSLALTIGIPLAYMIVMLFLRKSVMNKIQLSQQNALQEVKDYFGENKFESLLKTQRTYIDEYFESDEEEGTTDSSNTDSKEDLKEIESNEEEAELVEDKKEEVTNDEVSTETEEVKDTEEK